MLSSMMQDITNFHEKFGLPQREIGKSPSNKLANFRIKFILEELQELNTAMGTENLGEVLDALVDIVYVALGTAYCFNLPFDEAWKRVHEANMKKVRATDPSASKRGSTLDVVKPIGWEKPDIEGLLSADDVALKHPPVALPLFEQVDLVEELKKLKEK